MMNFQHADRAFGGHGWWWPLVGGVVPMILFAALIGLVVWAFLRVGDRGRTASALVASRPAFRPDGPIEEVRLRYARGEMSREDFIQRYRDLGGGAASPGAPSPVDPAPWAPVPGEPPPGAPETG